MPIETEFSSLGTAKYCDGWMVLLGSNCEGWMYPFSDLPVLNETDINVLIEEMGMPVTDPCK